MFLKNRNISSKIKRSKVTDYAALTERLLMGRKESNQTKLAVWKFPSVYLKVIKLYRFWWCQPRRNEIRGIWCWKEWKYSTLCKLQIRVIFLTVISSWVGNFINRIISSVYGGRKNRLKNEVFHLVILSCKIAKKGKCSDLLVFVVR